MLVGIEDLRRQILPLRPGTRVGWGPPRPVRTLSRATREAFRYPTEDVIKAVLDLARAQHLDVEVADRSCWKAILRE
jgi:hypothetical protein